VYAYRLEAVLTEDVLNAGVNDGQAHFSLGVKYAQDIILDHIFELGRGGVVWLLEDQLSNKLVVCTRDGYLQRWARHSASSAVMSSFMKLTGSFDPLLRFVYTLEEEISLCALQQLEPERGGAPLSSRRQRSSLGPPEKSQGGTESSTETAAAAPKEFTIRSMDSNTKDHIAFFVTHDGRAALLQGHIKEFESLKCVWLPLDAAPAPHSNASSGGVAMSISLNLRYHLIAVGLSNGDVELFNLLANFSYERTLSLHPWAITTKETGYASCLGWTSDGRALAVGYSQRGISTWSLSGCRLSCTIVQSHVLSGSSNKSSFVEAAGNGVVSLCWSGDGYSLIYTGPQKPGLLEELNLVKASLATNPNLNYCQRILLQGSDRLHLLRHSAAESDSYKWIQLPVPASYSADNWPVRLVSVSHDGILAAVSGNRGFCFVNLNTGNWRLFGDRTEEQTLNIAALCWFKHVVVATNQRDQDFYELLFFPSWNRLSISSLLYRAPLPHNRKPLYVDCNDHFLVIFTTDSFFYQYRIVAEYSKTSPKEITSISLKLVQQVSVGRAAASPASLLLLPATAQISSAPVASPNMANGAKTIKSTTTAAAKCVVLNSDGVLSLQNAEKSIHITLAQSVEQFWMANPAYSVSDQDLSNTLWAYGQFGLEVWFPFFQTTPVGTSTGPSTSAAPLTFLSRDRSLEFDLEVYPIGFLPDWAVIVGVSQGFSSPPASFGQGGPVFELQTKTHPFLHSILRRMIEKEIDITGVMAMARKYSNVPHYSHSLELLLHEVLEDEYQVVGRSLKQAKSSNGLFSPPPVSADAPPLPIGAGLTLRRVVELLKKLGGPLYAPLVVACARKTDPALWPLLFHPSFGADTPQTLFDVCIQNGDIRAAASYLRVLQLHDGDSAARRAGVTVVELCLSSGDWTLLRDLFRFLEPDMSETSLAQSTPPESPRSSTSIPSHLEEFSAMDSPHKSARQGSAEDDADEFLLDRALARYARDLLQASRMKDLVSFGRFCHRPPRYWFLRERKRAAIVHDYSAALSALHAQFRVPHPAYAPIDLLLQMQRTLSRSSVVDETSDEETISQSSDAQDGGSLHSSQSMDGSGISRRYMEYNAVYYPGSDFLLRSRPNRSASASSQDFFSDDESELYSDGTSLEPPSPRFSDSESAMQAAFGDLECVSFPVPPFCLCIDLAIFSCLDIFWKSS
jgi:hypothetical protein